MIRSSDLLRYLEKALTRELFFVSGAGSPGKYHLLFGPFILGFNFVGC